MTDASGSEQRPQPLLELTEEENIFRQSIRRFAEESVRPRVRQMDERGEMDPEVIAGLHRLGVMGVQIPPEYGGSGGSFFDSVLMVEELSRVDPSVGVLADVQNTLVNNALLRWATPEQKQRYLPKLASEWVGSFALSEAASGSDAFALETRAEDCGDHWSLSGRKLWTSNGKESQLFLIMATIDPGAGYRGITAFLVERDFAGFSVGKKEDKLGIRASSTAELILDDCRVPKENLLGQAGKGYKIAIETLNEGRIGIGAQMLGLAQGAWEHAARYAQQRKQFGKTLASFQAVSFTLAQMAADIYAVRLMVYDAARRKDAGLQFTREAAMAKLYASQVAERVASQAVEVFGGYGFTKDYPVEKLFRDSKIGSIYEGTTNIQLATIAKLCLEGDPSAG
jgi:alkylation response protein AidB-like acyl-CoA dehydrogenase